MTRRESLDLTRRVLKHFDEDSLDIADDVGYEPREAFTGWGRHVADLEMLRRAAHVVGWAGEVAEPGEYTVKEVLGTSVVISRARDGVLRAFVNGCAHRGAQVAQGCGRSRQFTCPYHGWTYGLDGRLTGAPARKLFAGADMDGRGLIELPVSERGGLLSVGLTDDVDVDGHLGSIAEPLSDYNFGQRKHFETRRFEVAANWKLNFDINFEGYHIKYVHGETLSPIATNNSVCDTFGDHVRWAFPFRDCAAMSESPEHDWPDQFFGTVAYGLFPSAVLVEAPGSLQMLRIYPGDRPGSSISHLSIGTVGDVPGAERQFHSQIMDMTCRILRDEDVPMAESCQRGLEGGVDHVVFGRNEPMLQHLAARWNAALAP